MFEQNTKIVTAQLTQENLEVLSHMLTLSTAPSTDLLLSLDKTSVPVTLYVTLCLENETYSLPLENFQLHNH